MARQVLLRMVELRRDGEDARRWASQREVLELDPARAPGVAAALADARLLVVDDEQVTVAHEALLRAWPTLTGWIAAERADLFALQELRVDADRWVAGGQSGADLYRGARLDSAIELAARHRLSGQDAAFVDAGRALRDHERVEARRRTRRLRLLASVATVLALLAATVGVAALVQRSSAVQARAAAEDSARRADGAADLAEEQRGAAEAAARDAKIEALVGRAAAVREVERDTAALLAAHAFQLADTPSTCAALFATFTDGGGFLDTHRLDGISGVEGGAGIAMPVGGGAYIVGADGRLRPYDLDTGEVGARWSGSGPASRPTPTSLPPPTATCSPRSPGRARGPTSSRRWGCSTRRRTSCASRP